MPCTPSRAVAYIFIKAEICVQTDFGFFMTGWKAPALSFQFFLCEQDAPVEFGVLSEEGVV